MLKQVFIINKELDMGKGKIAVQTAHGEVIYMNYLSKICDHSKFDEWMKDGVMKKVVLKALFEEMVELCYKLDKQMIWYSIIQDLGLTQVPKDSVTCIVVEPLQEEKTQELFGHLKLL